MRRPAVGCGSRRSSRWWSCRWWVWLPVAVFGWAGCAPEPVRPAPHLRFAESEVDVGTVAQGDTVRHRFAFTNDGGRDLRLREVRVSCDCDVRLDAPDVVAAGAGGWLEVELRTDDLSGPVRRTATVVSNDPQAPLARVALLAEVEARVVVEPRELYVGRVRRGERAGPQVEITFVDGSAARGERLEADGVVATPQWTTANEPGRRSFGVTIAADAPPGPFVETVVVHTTHPERPRLEVRVAGVVREPE